MRLNRPDFLVLAAAFLVGGLSAQTHVGNLNGSSTSSTFETGLANVGDSDTNLAALGWIELGGDTRLFRGSTNIAVISTGAYSAYSLRLDTGVAVQANTIYTLSFDLGFMTNVTGNTAYYSFELGTVNGGTFTSLTTAHTSSLEYNGGSGSLNLGSNTFQADSSQWTTGGTVSGDNLAVTFSLINYANTLSSSDFFGFDNVTLTAAAVPEPSTYAAIFGVVALGGAMIARRRRRTL